MSKLSQEMVYSHEISPTDRNRLRWGIRFSEKVGFELRVNSEKVMEVTAVYSKLNRHIEMKVAERGMNNSEEF